MEDLDEIVEVDLYKFRSVYGPATAQLRSEMKAKFKWRIEHLGDWMMVLADRNGVAGYLACVPTAKEPDSFDSWEATTQDGQLTELWDPNGQNVYVVSFAVLREATSVQAENVLFLRGIATFLRQGKRCAYWESRLPGLRDWVSQREGDLASIDRDRLRELAREYARATTSLRGRTVPLDPLLRLYSRIGCEFRAVVPDAYEDEPSLNFGVLTVYRNPLGSFADRLGTPAGRLLDGLTFLPWAARLL